MADNVGAGLARVVLAAPKRRLDLARPEQIPLAMLLPSELPRAAESLADDGLEHGGWAVRRTDGSALDMGRTLAAQGVRDGEILHLVPRYEQWPEVEYDDVVDAIAEGHRRYGVQWSGTATRVTGLAAGIAILMGALALVLRAGPPWTGPAIVARAGAAVLLGAGVLVARTVPDAVAGALIAATGQAYAFVGGLLLLAGDEPVHRLGAPHILLGCAGLLLAGLLGYLGVSALVRLFTAGILVGALGLAAGAVALTPLGATATAALLAAVAALLSPALPLLSVRLGKVPLPVLPRTSDDLLNQEPTPPAMATYAMVARADEILTGSLWAVAVLDLVCLVVLGRSGGTTATLLILVVCLTALLRARIFGTVRHRLPWLVTGVLGLATLLPRLTDAGSGARLVAGGLLLAGAVLAIAAALRYSHRQPSVYLGRIADILDVLLVLATAPIAAAELGVYGFVRGLGG